MVNDRYIEILELLANGINPITGEIFEKDSVYNEAEVIRALFFALNCIKSSSKKKKTKTQRQLENQVKGLPKNHGLQWSKEEKEMLKKMFLEDKSIKELSNFFERTRGAIIAELVKQGLIKKEEIYFYKYQK